MSDDNSQSKKKKTIKKVFDYDVFFENEQKNIVMQNKSEFLSLIKEQSKIESVEIDSSFSIPDLKGVLLRFVDKDPSRKHKALLEALKFVFEKVQIQEQFYTVCLIPNAMVNLVFGSRGKQINQIMHQTNTKVIANSQIEKISQRTVRAEGSYSDVALAVKLIYDIIEEKSVQVLELKKEPSLVSLLSEKTIARFVVSYTFKKYIDQKRDFIQWFGRENGVSLKFFEDQDHRQIRKVDVVCSLKGKLQDLFPTSERLIQTMERYFNNNSRDSVDEYLRVLVPSKYVTKIIGVGGCMIKDIEEKSKGANIKVMNDKIKDRDQKESLISIGGSVSQKVNACCIILQQLEIFKNGGGQASKDPSTSFQKSKDDYVQNSKSDGSGTKREGFSSKGEGFTQKRESGEGSGFNDGNQRKNYDRKNRSSSRSRSRSQHKKNKKDTRYSREKDPPKKVGIDEYEGRIKFVIPSRIASKFDSQTVQTIQNLSRCRKIYFEDVKNYDSFQDSSSSKSHEKKLIVKGTLEQNKEAFCLVQREIFYAELES